MFKQSDLQFTHYHSIVVVGVAIGFLLGAWLRSVVPAV
jgi:esterase/lipase